jgi:hypothetical protein
MVTTFLAISLVIRAFAGCADHTDHPEKPIRATIVAKGGYRKRNVRADFSTNAGIRAYVDHASDERIDDLLWQSYSMKRRR